MGELVDSVDVPAVQLGKRVGIGPRPFDERTFVERVEVRCSRHRP